MEDIAANDSEPKVKKQKKESDESGAVYPPIFGPDHALDYNLFQLSNTRLSESHQQKALGQLEAYLKAQQKTFLGYQLNENVHYSKKLSFMLDVHTNNIGDPFVNGNCTVNTKIMERAVLDYFARLWHAPTPSTPENKESYWGYVLSMGSTEGNLYALYNARDYLKGKALYKEPSGDLTFVRPVKANLHPKNAFHPIAFFSQDTHYSITKIVRALEIRTFYEIGEGEYKGQCPITSDGHWPKEVPSENGNEGPGSVDVDKLIQLVEFFARSGSPPLIILNIGTTFKGAYDNVEQVGLRLIPILKKYNLYERKVEYAPDKYDIRTGYWIHVDGALGASYLPFLAKAGHRIKEHIPKFDFSLPFVHSIVTSAHKYPGCPMPGGIYMTKHKYQIKPPDDPEYIGSPDTTFAGSRNAISPAVLWCYYANTSDETEIDKAIKVEETAKYAETKLKELERNYHRHGYKLWVERTPLAITIRFRDPSNPNNKDPNTKDPVLLKYSLSQMEIKVDGEHAPRKYVHIFIMQSVTKKVIDDLVHDLANAYDQNLLSKQENVGDQSVSVTSTTEHPHIHRVTHVPLDKRGYSGN
jgi:histidine decarboxylase